MKLLLQQLQTVFEGDTAPLSRLNNMIAAIYWSDENINWSGLYWIMHDGTADLGSFQGKPACERIAPHHGVIGHCVDTRKITVVNNVHEFPGHIACDGDTRSELVLPLFVDHAFSAVLDLDALDESHFADWSMDDLKQIQTLFSQVLQETLDFVKDVIPSF